MKNILSRLCIFTAIQGLTRFEKDLIPLIKDQGSHSYCWAYSITSAIELKYALKTGNRLKFNPFGIIDNVLDFYERHKNDPKYSVVYDKCKEFSSEEEGGPKELYIPGCALIYLKHDKKPMIYEYNNKSSNVILTSYDIVKIETVDDLIQALKKNKIIMAQYFATLMAYESNTSIVDYYITDDSLPINHNIVITGVGTIYGHPGIYVEIVNSWGLQVKREVTGPVDIGHDGLFYVKVADNITAPLVNNLRLFSSNLIIDVDELDSGSDCKSESVSKEYKLVAIILGILAGVFLCLFILFLVLFISAKRNIDVGRQTSGAQLIL